MADFEEITDYLKAISDPTRLKIVDILNRQSTPLCVNAIANRLSVTQSAVSQHLRILKQVGLVKSDRNGYHKNYQLKHNVIEKYTSELNEILDSSKRDTENCQGHKH